jgi:hypothetical protein
VTRYAEGTTVPVEQSQAEIRSLLARHGCKHFATAEEPGRSAIQFVLNGLPYRFTVEHPTAGQMEEAYVARRRPGMRWELDYQRQAAAEWRRRWRARLLWLKATLEFASGEGADEVAAALMAHLVLPGGATMQTWAARELPGAYANGKMPVLQLTGGGA